MLDTKKRIRITIGVPSATSFLHYKFVMSFYNLKFPENTDVNIAPVVGFQLPFARNQIIEEARKFNSDYVMMIDVDAIFPADSLIRLLSHQQEIVGALAVRRQFPHYPAIFKWNQTNNCYETIHYEQDSGLCECDATGMHVILIDMKIFDKISKPYFFYRDNTFSSDLTFCWQAKKANIQLYVDTSLKTGHLGEEYVATEDDYLRNSKPEDIAKYNADFLKTRKTV